MHDKNVEESLVAPARVGLILSGVLRAGMGPKWDDKALGDFAAGSYANMAATMPHYVQAKGATVVQVHGVGPFVVNYVNPADDPSK